MLERKLCSEFPLDHDWQYGHEPHGQRNRICRKCFEKEIEQWKRVHNPHHPRELAKEAVNKAMIAAAQREIAEDGRG